MLAAVSLPMGSVAVVEQRRETAVRLHIDTPAVTTIPPVRPTLRHELLTPKRDTPGAAGPGGDSDDRVVDEDHWKIPLLNVPPDHPILMAS